VLQAHSLVKGQLHEVYYWCDICSIKRFEKKICECCGGPMERREEPVKK
jgi:rRNA maturation endonuclease Nob1